MKDLNPSPGKPQRKQKDKPSTEGIHVPNKKLLFQPNKNVEKSVRKRQMIK